jgi:UDPglucose 6-dehydrogenase
MNRGIRFFGLGKLGLPLAALFASEGIRVVGIDTNPERVDKLRARATPIHEPGLSELLDAAKINLSFHVYEADTPTNFSIIHVPTPSTRSSPTFSSGQVESAIEAACMAAVRRGRANEPYLIIVASTVMPGTFRDRLLPLIASLSKACSRQFVLSYVPDFVAIGDVIRGFRRPPALIIGANDDDAARLTEELYAHIVFPEVRRVRVRLQEAELAKVAWNFYFCMKINFANMISRLAEELGEIDTDRVLELLTIDRRVGNGFMKSGMPFGGPCFPRDVDAIAVLCDQMDGDQALARAVSTGNETQLQHIVNLVLRAKPRRVGVLGLSFKQGTEVTTHSPSFAVIERLVSSGVSVIAFDPSRSARESLLGEQWAGSVDTADNLDEVCKSCDAILVAVDDARYASVADIAPPECAIIDPWARVLGPHPGLVRPGRR